MQSPPTALGWNGGELRFYLKHRQLFTPTGRDNRMNRMECVQESEKRDAIYAETVQTLTKLAMMHTDNQLCAECSMGAVGQALGEITMVGLKEPDHEKLLGALLEGYARVTGGTVVLLTPDEGDSANAAETH